MEDFRGQVVTVEGWQSLGTLHKFSCGCMQLGEGRKCPETEENT